MTEPIYPIEAIAQSYNEAQRIINRAACAVVYCNPLWQKVNRIKVYLDAQAAAELAEVLQ